MSSEMLPPHLSQANSWKRLFNERLQHFSEWDDRYQVLGSISQSALYKARQQLRMDTFHIANVGNSYDMIISTHDDLVQRLAESETEMAALQNNAPQEVSQAIKQARNTLHELIEQYNKQLRSLETSRKLLNSQRTALITPISFSVLKRQVDHTYDALLQSRTSLAIGRIVDSFCDDVDNNVQHVEREIERVNAVLTSIFARSEHHGSSDSLKSKLLSISKQRKQLTLLCKQAPSFHFSLATLFTRKSVLLTRFLNTLVHGVRTIYLDLNQYIDSWIKESLASLIQHSQYQKQTIENHKHRLVQLQKEGNGTSEQIAELQENMKHLQAALRSLHPLYANIISAQQASDNKNSIANVVQGQVVSLMEVRQAVAVN